MVEWIINYKDESTLEELYKIGEIKYQPEFEELNFIIILSEYSRDDIVSIEGVTGCRRPDIGSVYV